MFNIWGWNYGLKVEISWILDMGKERQLRII